LSTDVYFVARFLHCAKKQTFVVFYHNTIKELPNLSFFVVGRKHNFSTNVIKNLPALRRANVC